MSVVPGQVSVDGPGAPTTDHWQRTTDKPVLRNRPMPAKIWIDGRLVDKADAKISVYDHGLLYGDGVFEGIRAYSGRIFECEIHLDRFLQSARAIRLNIPYSREQLRLAMEDTIKA